MRWVAYMPLRGGSKSIPGKNIRNLAGKPLFAWALGEAMRSGCFHEIHAGTDAEPIREAVRSQFGDAVILQERSPQTCTDEASTESALLEFSARVDFDVLCLIQATSPLTSAADFRAAQKQFLAEKADSLLTATRTKRFIWSPAGQPLNYTPAGRPRRQDFTGSFMENGAFYFTRREVLENMHCRLGGRTSIYEMPAETAVEIDEPADWSQVETVLQNRRLQAHPIEARLVRALVVDVDGTLTDGGMYYGPHGEALKKFHTRDAHGLQRIRDAGLQLCVMTREDSEPVHARMCKLQIQDYHAGVTDKLSRLVSVADQWRLSLHEIAFMGDDLNDLACMRAAGLACCPRNAVPEVRAIADYVAQQDGGNGAVREVCDLLLNGHPQPA